MVEEQSIELFVTEKESLVLEALAQTEAPHSQRAQALLAVDAGSTIEQAAQVANLKVTQVRFWIGRFKNGRLGVFPEALIVDIESSLKSSQKDDVSGKEKKKKKKVKQEKKKLATALKGGKKKKLKKGKEKKKAAGKSNKTKKEKKSEKNKEVKRKKKKAGKKSKTTKKKK